VYADLITHSHGHSRLVMTDEWCVVSLVTCCALLLCDMLCDMATERGPIRDMDPLVAAKRRAAVRAEVRRRRAGAEVGTGHAACPVL
jgi:hypothetical protein